MEKFSIHSQVSNELLRLDPIWSKEQRVYVDQRSTTKYGVAAETLMARAGKALADVILLHFVQNDWFSQNKKILVLCGSGNNGGDGLVAADHLFNAGIDVEVLTVNDGETGSDLFQKHFRHFLSNSAKWYCWSNQQSDYFRCDKQSKSLGKIIDWTSYDLIVDALIGIGFKGSELNKPVSHAIKTVNHLVCYKVAVDIPSGLICNSGNINHSKSFVADSTVTFGAIAPCHVLGDAKWNCGKVVVKDIQFPAQEDATQSEQDQLLRLFANTRIETPTNIWNCLWDGLAGASHKFNRGHVHIIGGSPGKYGAGQIAALAALRGGAGWVSVSSASNALQKTACFPMEVTTESTMTESGLDQNQLEQLVSKRKVTSLVIGPGFVEQKLSKSDIDLLIDLQDQYGVRVVFDAGALHGLYELLSNTRSGKTFDPLLSLITPHPGEWQKFSGNALGDPHNADNHARLLEVLHHCGVSLIYKSSTPLILSPSLACVCVLASAGNALARAGTGDMLAGLTAAFTLRTSEIYSAVALAYSAIGSTFDLLSKNRHKMSISVEDVIQCLGE